MKSEPQQIWKIMLTSKQRTWRGSEDHPNLTNIQNDLEYTYIETLKYAKLKHHTNQIWQHTQLSSCKQSNAMWISIACCCSNILKLVDKYKRQDPTVSTATFVNQLQNTTATACNADPQNFHSLQNEVATYFAFHSNKWQCTQASGWLQLLARQLQGCVHVDKYLRVLLVTEATLDAQCKGTNDEEHAWKKLVAQAMLDAQCKDMHTTLDPCLYCDAQYHRCLGCDAQHPMSTYAMIHWSYMCTWFHGSLLTSWARKGVKAALVSPACNPFRGQSSG